MCVCVCGEERKSVCVCVCVCLLDKKGKLSGIFIHVKLAI